MGKEKFKEERRFGYWEFYALLSFLIAGAMYRILEQFIFSEMVNWSAVGLYSGIVLLALAVIYLVSQVKLLTVVSKKGIRYQLYPLHSKKRKVNWDDIEDYKVVDLPGKNRMSGWNVSFNTDHKTFGFGESTGLYVKMKDGENLFIGVESKKDLEKYIARFAK